VVKVAKKTLRAIKHLEQLSKILDYYTRGRNDLIKVTYDNTEVSIQKMIDEIKTVLIKLSEDRKVHDAKLWNKFKVKSHTEE
jgi:hypothetical protein